MGRIFFGFGISAIFLVSAVGYWFYSSLTSPVTHENSDRFIKIERGMAPGQIVAKLSDERIIKNPFAVRVYLRLFGDASKLQAGEYRFSSPITPLQVLKVMEKGNVETRRLTIPEGFTRFDIAKRIAGIFPGNPPKTEKQILSLMDDTGRIREIAPEARDLEGYLFPSTYEFAPSTSPDEIINELVEQFRKIWKPEWTDRAREMGKTPHQIVTIASMVETESPIESERPVVASVIYNRLNRNIPLGIDQTAVYVAKMEGRWDKDLNKSDLNVSSPYNTRKYAGLPPGPIASVSTGSIIAALYPAETNYLYFVRNVRINNGSHNFYASATEFEKGKAEYQRWLGEERKIRNSNARN